MITIINYGMGNIGSVKNMVKSIGYSSIISSQPEDIKNATKLILPGVGSFDQGMKNIHELGILDILNKQVLVNKIPILGICLGFQLLTRRSDEGTLKGLNWIEAETKKFQFYQENKNLKIPHMGWNNVTSHPSSRLFRNWQGECRFYFVHSYHVVCEHTEDILSQCQYGYSFTSSIEKDNIMGVQFHPEKSHKFGKQLLKNFFNL